MVSVFPNRQYIKIKTMHLRVDEFHSNNTFFIFCSDFVDESQIRNAIYVRGAYKSYLKFGDIVSLARGRLETDGNNKFFFIEMDRNECKKLNCSLNDNVAKNITTFWLVEKVRHRDEKYGHRYELRITIFPIKKLRLDSKRETSSTVNEARRRSFLVREQDYPKYFDETMKPNGKIQKRFFDLMGSLSEHPYEEYRIPFTLDGYQNRYPEELNTGEYYSQSKRNGEQLYQRPTVTTNSYGGHHIKFPDPSAATNEFLEATRNYPGNPFTSTHLHHHYYLNRNNIPLIKATGYEKETVYENLSEDYRQQDRVRNPQIDEISTQIQQQSDQRQSSKEHQQEPNAAPQNNAIPTAIGAGYNFYTEQPRHVYDVSDSSGLIFANHQNFQTPYSLSDQLPAPPSHLNQFYQQTPYSYPLQLQVVTPPQQYLTNTHENAPITATPYNLGHVQQYPIEQFRPIIDFPARFNRQQFPIQNNDVNGNFNQQFEPNRYSEPDPIYHGENIPLPPYTRQVGFDPVIDIGNHHQQQPTQNPDQNQNQIQTNMKLEHQTLKTVNGGYEIGPSKSEKRPERQRVNVHTEVAQQKGDRNENQTKYPDSINAQLPPPEQDDDLTVPYVESSVVTQTSIQSTSAESIDYSRHSGYEKPRRVRPRGYYGPRTTTEKPILKWMPKRTKPKGSLFDIDDTSSSSSSTPTPTSTTTEAVVTVTPINSQSEEPRTSISTSISVQIGTKPDTQSESTVSPENSQPPISTDNSTENQDSEDYIGFLPTVIPNVQLVRGRIEAIKTNSSNLKLFRSGEVDNDAEEDHVAESIVKHASNL